MARYIDQRNSLSGRNAAVNPELEKIAETQADHLSRKEGDAPNHMETTLDMNSERVINLPDPVSGHEAVPFRLIQPLLESIGQALEAVDAAKAWAELAEYFAMLAEAAADRSEVAAELSEQVYDDFQRRYLGAKAEDPTTDNQARPLEKGAVYFNTVFSRMLVWTGTFWDNAYDRPRIIPEVITADYTVSDQDIDQKYLNVESANDVTITINSLASDNMEGTIFYVSRKGSGEVVVVSDTGVTINSSATNLLRATNSLVILIYTGNGVWDMSGDLVALE